MVHLHAKGSEHARHFLAALELIIKRKKKKKEKIVAWGFFCSQTKTCKVCLMEIKALFACIIHYDHPKKHKWRKNLTLLVRCTQHESDAPDPQQP